MMDKPLLLTADQGSRRGRLGFWLLASAVYAALLFSVVLHYVWGPSVSTSLTYFTVDQTNLGPENGFPDVGRFSGLEFDLDGADAWKVCSAYGDAAFYLIQARTLRPTHSPYSFRMLAPWLAGLLHRVSGLELPYCFLALNLAAVFAAALIFTEYLRRFHGSNRWIALLGGILLVTSSGVVRTVPFPLADPLSYLWVVLLFWSVRQGNIGSFLVFSLLGVITKPVLAFGALLWPIVHWPRDPRNPRQWLFTLAPALGPVAFFVTVRLIFSGSPGTVHYGYNLLKGELPNCYGRLLYWEGLFLTLLHLFLSFTFMWSGLINLRRDKFLLKAFFTVVIPVTIAVLLLSSRIIRPMGILYPIIIPLFLLFIPRIRKRLGEVSADDGQATVPNHPATDGGHRGD